MFKEGNALLNREALRNILVRIISGIILAVVSGVVTAIVLEALSD